MFMFCCPRYYCGHYLRNPRTPVKVKFLSWRLVCFSYASLSSRGRCRACLHFRACSWNISLYFERTHISAGFVFLQNRTMEGNIKGLKPKAELHSRPTKSTKQEHIVTGRHSVLFMTRALQPLVLVKK